MTNDERLAALRDELTLRECGIDVPERHGSPVPVAASRDDLAERVFVLKEALRGLLLLRAQEQAGVRVPDRDDWERAWKVATEVYGEER